MIGSFFAEGAGLRGFGEAAAAKAIKQRPPARARRPSRCARPPPPPRAMPNRKGARNAYYFFVREKLPELQRRGLPVARVPDAIPLCSRDWALLTEDEKEKYAEMARKWRAKNSTQASMKQPPSQLSPVPAPLPMQIQRHASLPDAISLSWKNDQGEVPRGFRFHCQAASDATHKIPISGFELSNAGHPVVLRELYSFVRPNRGRWPPVYCKSDDWYRVNWCLKWMAKEAGIENQLELLSVENLVVELYQRKLQKEPSKTWVRNLLDVFMWDYSSNTRCKWHEENDILFCALASCKKTAYCISNTLASVYGVSLTTAHLPLQDYGSSNNINPKVVVLDAGRFQKLRTQNPGCSGYFSSPVEKQGAASSAGEHPSGVTSSCSTSIMRGRGITRLLESVSRLSKSSSN
ncbi:protein maelstrom homolog isoform X2 [Trachemys scripta elegans]|uniref:protein maelstrom homolog isoform X2 n=1 Tax=Trachemys scripta elegans TaxID=31138 RepID=UPI001555BBB7|nr:protein maelstrom homolog isoform X2 [Trachemys scripta elegans]